jgi:hypothetical protein
MHGTGAGKRDRENAPGPTAGRIDTLENPQYVSHNLPRVTLPVIILRDGIAGEWFEGFICREHLPEKKKFL